MPRVGIGKERADALVEDIARDVFRPHALPFEIHPPGYLIELDVVGAGHREEGVGMRDMRSATPICAPSPAGRPPPMVEVPISLSTTRRHSAPPTRCARPASRGRSPIAGISHAAFILLFILFGSKLMAFVPMAALAAILFMVSWGMSEYRHFLGFLRMPNGDRVVLLLTFGLTVLVDLTVAIGVGVTLASLIFMARMSSTVEIGSGFDGEDEDLHQRDAVPPGVEVFRMSGPFFFGVVGGLMDTFRAMGQQPHVIILRMRLVPMIDASGATALEGLVNEARRGGIQVILSGVQPQPLEMLRRVHLNEENGRVRFAKDFAGALQLAQTAKPAGR